jgi:amino acid permease
MGKKLYGKPGEITVNIALWMSQLGFCVGYVFFIKENIHDILTEAFGIDIGTTAIAIIEGLMFTFLCWVRKIEKFAVGHTFADIMIMVTLLTCVVYGAINLDKVGNQRDTVYKVNP